MTKLTDMQSLLLSHASKDAAGSLLPLPSTCARDDERVAKAAASLLRRNLLEERVVDAAALVWRSADDRYTGLFITPAGLRAIGAEGADESGDANSNIEAASASASIAPAPRRPSKIATVLVLLGRTKGATLAEMVEATGWLPHTTRAALTGLRKKGHVLAKSRRGDETCYRIANDDGITPAPALTAASGVVA